MKRVVVLLVMAFLLSSVPVCAGTTDKGLVNDYCKTHYKGYAVKYVSEGSDLVKHRKGKKYVVVETLNTTCTGGKNGRTTKGYYTRYTKSDKKGNKVKQYLIYNPKNNAIDDVVAVVDHKRIK